MVLGVFEGDTIVEHWRIATVPDRTDDEIAALLHGLLARSTVVREGSRSRFPASGGGRAWP